MSKTFRIELLPALHGDCIWVEYGDVKAPRRILIDGGPIGAYPELVARIEETTGSRKFQLLVVTHVDSDHIEGAIKLLNHTELGVNFDDIWFNGWPQLKKPLLGTTRRPGRKALDRSPAQGGLLAVRLTDRGETWNKRFFGRAALVSDEGPLPRISLEGGLTLTLLAPTAEKLKALRTEWTRAVKALGTTPDDEAYFRSRLERDRRLRGQVDEDETGWSELSKAQLLAAKIDRSVANGSSIAFVAEYGAKRCAFLGDAHMPEIESGVTRLARELGETRLRLDAVKLSHHGSSGNLTRSFLQRIECGCYLVSTNGNIFGHPDDDAIETIIRYARAPVHLVFNYLSERTRRWADEAAQEGLGFRAQFPEPGCRGVAVELLPEDGGA